MYPELRGNTGADARELDVLKRWKEKDIFGRSVSERPADTIFSFYEGPPTVNGMPGIHHVLSRTLKDTICRYKTMQGFRVERKAGWDTHGLPVELAIEKQQGFKHKHDIIEFGIEKFNELCRASVYENISREGGWGEMTERMAYWVDMSNPYITCTPNYVESLWWALKQFHDKKLIYKGHKIQPYCPRCETALSSHEVSLGYDTAKDPSVFVKFKRKNTTEDEYFLAWTTTPWTLLANVALAVHPDVDYVTVINTRIDNSKVDKSNKKEALEYLINKFDSDLLIKERLVLAEALLGKLEGEVEIVSKTKGRDLEGEQYERLFDYLPPNYEDFRLLLIGELNSQYTETIKYYNDNYPDQRTIDIRIAANQYENVSINQNTLTSEYELVLGIDQKENWKNIIVFELGYFNYLFSDLSKPKAFCIVSDNYVTTEDGTGIVHQAPAFGEDDYRIAQRHGFPTVITVDPSGSINLESPFKGKFFKDADPEIMDALKKKGLLYRKETVEHTYPFCWRCGTPLMYYARDSWYINVQGFKQQLIDTNKTIGWHPVEIRDGRFGNWLEELKDWGISRERFWGTPFPLWVSEDGKEIKAVGSYTELVGAEWLDNEGNPTGKLFTEEDAKNFDPHKPNVDKLAFKTASGYLRRVPDVIDVWFDSGGMPFAQYHYPFENKELFEKAYPADYISEGIDQTRGWFYTLHAINTFLFGKPPYKNVIVNDMVLDKNGQKMSKSKGNTVNPFELLSTYGADAVRWNFLSGSVPWKPKLFNPNDIAELERKFFGTLTNTYNFFTLYANIDGYKRSANADGIAIKDRTEMDRWILSKLNSLIKNCTDWMNDYDLTRSTRAIEEFVTEELSNWYVRRSRRRFWKGEMNADKTAAYDTLYECLATIAKLSAPYAPFMSDILYSALTGEDSVHLALYPKADEVVIDVALEVRMQKAQVISSLTRQMRERAKIKVRQPLERILIPSANRREIEELRKVEDIIIDEVNVKRVEYILYGDSDVIKRKAKANFKVLGAKLGKDMKTVAAAIGAWKETDIQTFDSQGFIEIPVGDATYKIVRSDVDITAEDVEGWLVSSEGGVTVALDTSLSAALISEGIAREFVNRIQNLRKDSGFEVTDRITIAVGGAPEILVSALREHESYISQETLAHSINSNGGVGDGTDIDLGELTAKVKIEKR